MPPTSGLTVRQHERRAVELIVEFVVCDAHREQVRFSPISTAGESHVTRGTTVDISPGGIRLMCRQFVPRMCEGLVRVMGPKPVPDAGDGSPVYEVAFEHRVKVHQVAQSGREPTYALGVAFVDPGPDIEQRVAMLVDRYGAAEDNPGQGRGDTDA